MTEPSSTVPGEIADAEVETDTQGQPESDRVELHLDEDKIEAWDEVKADYEVEPGGVPLPNSMDATEFEPVEDEDDEDDEGSG
jgi:hypothetical protein